MNGIEKITEHIEADCRAEVERIQAEAKAQCEKIENEYNAKAQEEYWKLIQAGSKAAEQQVERLGNVAVLEGKKKVLGAKQEVVSEAFDLAQKQLTELPDDEYTSLLAKLAAEAVSSGSEKLVFSVADRARCGKAVCKKANELLEARGIEGGLTLSEKTADISGGVIVSSGSVEVNCSFETLIGQARSSLATEVAKLLFAGIE